MPLRDPASLASSHAGLRCNWWVADQPCPGCETIRRRLEPSDADLAVWYDTMLGDWVVQVPCPGFRGGVLMPLGLRWFDVPWPEVYRAAGDVAFADDAFDDALGDEQLRVQ